MRPPTFDRDNLVQEIDDAIRRRVAFLAFEDVGRACDLGDVKVGAINRILEEIRDAVESAVLGYWPQGGGEG